MTAVRSSFYVALTYFLGVHSSLEGSLSVEYIPLDGDALYEFSWAGSPAAAHAEDVAALRPSDESLAVDDEQLLPNQLLPAGYTEEVVSMVTAQHEKYKCVLPHSRTNEDGEDDLIDSKYLTPESLLQPLQLQCLKLNQGYWSYELCHGQSLRQFHEENTGKELKMDEYILGKVVRTWQPNIGDMGGERQGEEGEGGSEDGEEEKIPTWHFNGVNYPYYKVEMSDGTPCDLRGNNPRSVSILYVCQTDTPTFGTLLLVEEASACHYVAIVGTKQLCQNKAYRLKEEPVYTISCYSEGDSPKKPNVLREQEFDVVNAAHKQPSTGSSKTTTEDPMKPKVTEAPPSPAPSLDEGIILNFLSGEMCLRGGSGWWIHELCLQKQVKQLHQESDMSETQVILGVWNEDAHKAWYLKEGHKKKSKTGVTHIYEGGDVCDVTGKPRFCYVKFKCSKSKSPSQISLYLLEQSVCVYQLTVEGQFICNLLSQLDDHGLFQVQQSGRLFDPAAQADSGSEEVDQSHSGSTSGQSEVESEDASVDVKSQGSQTHPTLEQSQSHSDSTSEQSQSHSDSTSEQSESHPNSISEQSESHSDSTSEESQYHSGSKSGQKP